MPNTKSPVAVLTWPPPSWATYTPCRRLADDLVGVLGPGQHVGVGHAHHRQVLVALPPAVARAGPPLLAGPQPVPHVVGEDAVLDQDVAPGRVALVVDGDGSPLRAHGAVVDQRDQRAGHQLADLPREHRDVLGDVIGLQTVTARLVEQDAAAPLLDDHRQAARRRRPGRQLGQRPVAAATGQLLDRSVSNSSNPTVAPTVSRPVCMPVSPWPRTTRRSGSSPGRRSARTPSLLATRIWRRLSP